MIRVWKEGLQKRRYLKHIVSGRIPIPTISISNHRIAGLNYCAIATLSFLSQSQKQQTSIQELVGHTGFDLVGCARWMLERQTTWIEEEDADDDDEDDEGDDDKNEEKQSDAEAKPDSPERDVIAGFCGRSGKIADTCYCFWNVGALKVGTSQRICLMRPPN